jgi:hypothetical protein
MIGVGPRSRFRLRHALTLVALLVGLFPMYDLADHGVTRSFQMIPHVTVGHITSGMDMLETSHMKARAPDPPDLTRLGLFRC